MSNNYVRHGLNLQQLSVDFRLFDYKGNSFWYGLKVEKALVKDSSNNSMKVDFDVDRNQVIVYTNFDLTVDRLAVIIFMLEHLGYTDLKRLSDKGQLIRYAAYSKMKTCKEMYL